MMTHSLSIPARAALAAIALAAVSTGANAFPSSAPDPFLGQTVNLQATPPGTWVALPGLGYTTSFIIDNFRSLGVAGDIYTYDADFTSALSDTVGGPVARTADLTGIDNFVVQMVGRTDPYSTGIFDLVLQTADFSGTVDGQLVEVSLANIPTARVSITGTFGDFEITYITPFSIDGQYALDGGDPIEVPGLGDVNGQPPGVPVPATALLMIPGFLGVLGLRRRRAAAAA